MSRALSLAAVDLGAESGRVVVGRLADDRITLRVVHRFPNRPVWLPDGLHWSLLELLTETLTGLGIAAEDEPLSGVGIDSWGCDYALLDAQQRVLGLPFHYRDARTSEAVVNHAHARVGRSELYRRTGIQTMPINTVYQLMAEAAGASPTLSAAKRIAMISDVVGLWLTGTLANEVTIASTTGLLEARGRRWARDLVKRLSLPQEPFSGETVTPGIDLGPILAGHDRAAGRASGTIVRTVAGHDTASAFAAAPLQGERGAVLSSGTWSLLGLELAEPELGPGAATLNLTNERGVEDTTRLLRNVMGLWLIQECRRGWQAKGQVLSYDQLQTLAADARPDVPVFNPDDTTLLRGGDMPQLIANLCTGTGQRAPEGPGEVVRSILVSLACRYRVVLEGLIDVSRREVDVVHVVGGGARNQLLCQLTADLLERPVLAGPVEATAVGNVLTQAMGLGAIAGLEQLREIVRQSVDIRRFEPSGAQPAAETYQRFRAVLGPPAVCPFETAA